MGIASYQRGNKAISNQLQKDRRPLEFETMDRLNNLPKYADCGQPFGDIYFIRSHNRWWAECPHTGFGFHYPSLQVAVKSWNVFLHTYDHGTWVGSPITGGHVRYNNTKQI